MSKQLFDFYFNDLHIVLANDDVMGLHQILRQNDAYWEECHNFIQWIIPNPFPSKYNPDAPLLTHSLLTQLDAARVLPSITRFLNFLGINCENSDEFILVDHSRIMEWTTGNNHNKLRVTRLLIFCYCLEQFNVLDSKYIDNLVQCFRNIVKMYADNFNDRTLYEWFTRAEFVADEWCSESWS